LINVSDDEDLITAYQVANKELGGNLKFVIDFKQLPKKPVEEETKSLTNFLTERIKEKIEKKVKKMEKKEKKEKKDKKDKKTKKTKIAE
jgi:hypothetical protein